MKCKHEIGFVLFSVKSAQHVKLNELLSVSAFALK